jgi:hypothetical protein
MVSDCSIATSGTGQGDTSTILNEYAGYRFASSAEAVVDKVDLSR